MWVRLVFAKYSVEQCVTLQQDWQIKSNHTQIIACQNGEVKAKVK
jgi:hypothetical protein